MRGMPPPPLPTRSVSDPSNGQSGHSLFNDKIPDESPLDLHINLNHDGEGNLSNDDDDEGEGEEEKVEDGN
jgi:hypothetical protein